MEERYKLENSEALKILKDDYPLWYMFANYEKSLPKEFIKKYTKVIELEKIPTIPLEKILQL